MLQASTPHRFSPIAREQQREIAQKVCAMRYEISAAPEPTPRKLLGCSLGEINVVYYESCGVEHGVRTLEHIRTEPSDYFLLCLPLQARFRFRHVGQMTEVGCGFGVLLTAQHPFDAYVDGIGPTQWHSSLQVRIPGPLLRSRLATVDQLCNRAFPVSAGGGAILHSLLDASLKQASVLSDAQAVRLGHVLADMIAAAALPLGEAELPPPRSREAGRLRLLRQAQAYIDSHLSSPGLDVRQIAAHCKVSSRYLHSLFAECELTVAGTVREARLCRCREALRDPQLAHQSVIEIASRWGFVDPSHFGRLYKQRFGILPSKERPPR